MTAAFIAAILFAISGVSGSRSSRLLGGTEAHFWRLLLAMVLLTAVAQTWGAGLSGAALPVFLVSGAVGFGAGDLALFQALPRLGSRLSMMIVQCLSSPIAALIEFSWLGTKLSPGELLCGLIILLGVGFALAPKENPHIARVHWVPGVLFGLGAAFCQAYGAVLSRRAFDVAAQSSESIDGISAAYQRVLGGVMVTALCLLMVKRREIVLALGRGHPTPDPSIPARGSRWRQAWPWVLLNGISGPAVGVSCFQWALKSTPTGVVLPIVALTPLIIIPIAYVVEGERPSGRSLAGGALAVCGAVALAFLAGQGD